MDYLKLEGKDHPFLFAIKASKEMQKADLQEKDDLYFIYLGLKYGAIREKKQFPYTEDALIDIFEDDLEAYEHACDLLGSHMGKLKKMKAKMMQALADQ